MHNRELDATGVMLPEVGLGTWKYKGGVAPLRRGLELGAFLVDTAEIYGSEGVVGEAIKGQRDRFFVATKVSGDHLRHDQVIKAADASLKRLGIDVIDLYQVHWPDPTVPLGETMSAMEELVDAGKVRFIGVSNFSREQVEEAQTTMRRHRIVANQVEYSLQYRDIEPDIEAFYVPNRITVIAYSPLGRGQLMSSRKRFDLDMLRAVAAEAGKTPAQVALNWCLSHAGVITIPKTDRVARVDDLCGATGWSLTPDQVGRLESVFP